MILNNTAALNTLASVSLIVVHGELNINLTSTATSGASVVWPSAGNEFLVSKILKIQYIHTKQQWFMVRGKTYWIQPIPKCYIAPAVYLGCFSVNCVMKIKSFADWSVLSHTCLQVGFALVAFHQNALRNQNMHRTISFRIPSHKERHLLLLVSLFRLWQESSVNAN